MSNRYILGIGTLGQTPELEIDKACFERLKASRSALSHALAIEEKYEILISNYFELERDAITASVSKMVRDPRGYRSFFDIRSTLNIRLVNLLTVVRLYTDQLPSHICACVPNNSNAKSDTKQFFSAEYDSSFQYRFMEELRNHVQHRNISVHRVSTNEKRTDLNDSLVEYSLHFSTRKKELLLDGGFKSRVLNEMPEEVNLMSASRCYVEAISRIHKQAREIIGETIESSRQELEKAISDYQENYGKDPVGLCAYEYQGEQKVGEVSVLLKWDDIRIELVKRNSELVNLRKRYVSSQAHDR